MRVSILFVRPQACRHVYRYVAIHYTDNIHLRTYIVTHTHTKIKDERWRDVGREGGKEGIQCSWGRNVDCFVQ